MGGKLTATGCCVESVPQELVPDLVGVNTSLLDEGASSEVNSRSRMAPKRIDWTRCSGTAIELGLYIGENLKRNQIV